MTTNPGLGQAHETCGGVKLVMWDPNLPTSGQRKTIRSIHFICMAFQYLLSSWKTLRQVTV